jgi:ATP-binding cassette subfamily B protein
MLTRIAVRDQTSDRCVAVGHTDSHGLRDAFRIVVVLLFADGLFWRLAGWIGVKAFVAVTGDARRELFWYLTGHTQSYFSELQPGTLACRVSATANATYTIENTVAWSALPVLLSVLGAVALVGSVNLLMALALISLSAGLALVLFRLARRRTGKHMRFATEAASVDGELVDVVSNMGLSGLLSRPPGRYAVATICLSAGLLGWVVWLWTNGRATTGDVVLVSSLGFAILHGTRDLAVALVDLTQHIARLMETAQTLFVARGLHESPDAPWLEIRDANIDFENITFAYAGRRPLLKHFSLHIDAGQRVGLVGPSGAGKSTVLALLQRIFDPSMGSVCVSGQRLCEVKQRSLHAAVAVVPQEVSLFNRSLLDNLRYGRPDATEEEVIKVCHLADCEDLLTALPEGLQTIVGDPGTKLSGGQRQRIAIARAMLTDAPILLLDEATSALDSASEAIVQAALERLMQGRTVVAIAHRLSTLQNFDRIVVIQQGRVVDDGPPSELARHPGIYRDVLLRLDRRAEAAAPASRVRLWRYRQALDTAIRSPRQNWRTRGHRKHGARAAVP